MKNFFLLFIIVSNIAFTKNISLDIMLIDVEQKNYQNDIYTIEKKGREEARNNYKLGDFNGVKAEITSNYNTGDKKNENIGKVSVGPFYVEGHDKKDGTENYSIFGIEKNINDIFYSKEDSNLKKLDYTERKEYLNYRSKIEDEKIKLINLYKEYKINEQEIKIKNSGIEILKIEREKILKSFELGEVAKITLDVVEVNLKNIGIEISILKDMKKRIEEKFLLEFDIDIQNFKLLDIEISDIDIREYISQYGESDIEKLKLENNINKEDYEYKKFQDKYPSISLGIEHNTLYNDERIVLKLSKNIFDNNLEVVDADIKIKTDELKLNQYIKENETKKRNIKDNYDSYLKDYLLNKNKAELEKQKYKIKILEYSLGKITYFDVMTSFNDYMDYEVIKEKAKNNLYAYVYEIKMRGE